MNSHIPNFFEPIANGDSPPDQAELKRRIRLYIMHGSPSQCQKYEQENPQPIHEMPVNRSQLRSRRLRDARALPLPERDVKQCQDSAGQMRAMRGGQKIKEAAARIRREQHSRRGELAPGNDLPGQETASRGRSSPTTSFERLRGLRLQASRRATIMVTLLASSIAVLNHTTRGIGVRCQSVPRPLRTMYELASAMKNMTMAASPSCSAVK